jgi:hypothetical protein
MQDIAGYTMFYAMLGIMSGCAVGLMLAVVMFCINPGIDKFFLKMLIFSPAVIIGCLAGGGGFIGSATGFCYTNPPGLHNDAVTLLTKNHNTFFQALPVNPAAVVPRTSQAVEVETGAPRLITEGTNIAGSSRRASV